jgi:protein TonB
MGSIIAFSLVVFVVGTGYFVAWLTHVDEDAIPMAIIKTIADLGPPPSVVKKPPQVQVQQPDVVKPKIGIPTPVADDELLDEDVVIASRDELMEMTTDDISSLGDGEFEVDIDYIPGSDEFVAVEIQPEMIYEHRSPYPKFAKSAGLEGVIWVKALVDEEGNVMKAIIAKECGVASLDELAVKDAYEYKYKPAIQNGRPTKVWVAYKVEYKLH